MKHISICFIFLLFLLNSCTKNTDDYRTSGAETVIIRGYEARNDIGQTLRSIGNPDIRLRYPTDKSVTAALSLFAFPNPGSTSIEVQLYANAFNGEVRVWIVPASFTSQESVSTAFLGPLLLASLGKPLFDKVFQFIVPEIVFHISELAEGYYRIYAKADGNMVWDNIVFSKAEQRYN